MLGSGHAFSQMDIRHRARPTRRSATDRNDKEMPPGQKPEAADRCETPATKVSQGDGEESAAGADGLIDALDH